jgi:Fe-S-cluster containining protein
MPVVRLAILGSSPCHRCTAACCRLNGHDYSVLLEPDEHARFRPFSIDLAVMNGTTRVIERVIPYRERRCLFLGDDNLCTIYDDRPRSCRSFECIKGYGGSLGPHSRFLDLNPHVRQLLDTL